MIFLRTLGRLAVEGVEPDAGQFLLAGGKRFAVLLYLLGAGRGAFVRRETLLAMFWPEADERHARGALRSIVHQLRAGLGTDALLARADHSLAVDTTRVGCDVLEFDAACDRGDWQAAAGAFRGDLLDGFGISGAPAFEDWLAAERDRMRARYTVLAHRAAGAAFAEGRFEDVVDVLRSLLRHTPFDERAVRMLMEALEHQGLRSTALATYQHFESRLLGELDAMPEAATRELEVALRSRAHEDSSTLVTAPSPRDRATTGMRRRTAQSHRVAAVLTVALAGGVAIIGALGRREPPDYNSVAVFPFFAAGVDTGTARIAAAAPMLIATRLPSGAAVHVADIGAMTQRIVGRAKYGSPLSHRQASGIARDLDAARAILGSVTATDANVLVNASLLDAVTRRPIATAAMSGRADSLPVLIESVTSSLLARAAAEPEPRIGILARTPLAAVVWYLEGQQHLRAHAPAAARAAFAKSLQIDSTFATAALAISIASPSTDIAWQREGLEIAWRFRTALAPVDLAVTMAKLGPQFPEASPLLDQLLAWERLVPGGPSQPHTYEILYNYADHLFHYGQLLGIDNALDRARVVFERAARTDSTFPGAVQHLADLAFILQDTTELRKLVSRLSRSARAELRDRTAQWMLAAATNDTVALNVLGLSLNTAPVYNLSLQAGIHMDEANRVARAWREGAATTADATEQLRVQLMLALNRASYATAASLLDTIFRLSTTTPQLEATARATDRLAVLAHLYWGAPEQGFGSRVNRLARWASIPADTTARRQRARDACVLEEWKLSRGDVATVTNTMAGLDTTRAVERICLHVLGAYRAVVERRSDARPLVDTLDAMARTVPPGWREAYPHGNLLISQLYERLGATDRALAAARRRGIYHLNFNLFLSAHLAAEARLARLAGDTTTARVAERHYTGLRGVPLP